MRRWCSTVVHSIAMCGFEKVASSILHQCKCGPGPSESERKERRAFLVRIRPCFVLAFCMSRSVFGPAHPERCLTAVTHNEAICHHCRRRTRAGANRRRFSARRRSARAPACSLSLAMYATS